MDVCEHASFATSDVEAASLTAIGLLPIDERASLETLQRGARAGDMDRRVLTRRTEIAWLLERLTSRDRHTQPAQVRAQLPIALARLAADMRPSLREALAQALLYSVRPAAREPNEVEASVALALGELGDTDVGGTDQVIREALAREVREGDATTRRFALIALGRIGGRPGDREDPSGGLPEVRESLLESLEHGHSQLEVWAALGLGLLAHGRNDAGAPHDPAIMEVLRQVAGESRQPQEIGAYAVALGLANDSAATPILLERLEKIEAAEARAPLALALGMLGHTSAIAVLRATLADTYAQQDLFVEIAVGLALMGDKDVVPFLLTTLHEAGSQATELAACQALSRVGDARALEPLLELLQARDATVFTRAAAAHALGGICDPRSLPWDTPLSVGSNYLAILPTLTDGQRGILDYE
jgi:HEAT repeat protein